MSEPIRTPIGMMWVNEAGLLYHRLDEGVIVRAEHAAGIREAVREVSGGAPIRAVVDISGVEFADRKARDAIASSLDDSNEVATAVVVGSPVSRALGTLFLKLSRPARPVRLFLDEEEAARWVAAVPDSD
ncbi:MAG: hypothetical protein HKN80_07135 [Acidimicrobiia bacterium]|nr:hypothetical protein [Acidimicrobiia bacterium]